MKNLDDKITMQCAHCGHMVKTFISHIREDKSFACSNCLSRNEVDVEKLLKGLEALMKKVEEKRDSG